MMPFAELLQKREATRDLVARATQHIVNSIQRGKLVTHDILRYTQPAEPALEPLALDAWWASFIAEAQVLLGDNIVMRTSIEPLAVMADAGQLAQVFANLISNARDAMRKGGELAIRVCEAEHGFLPQPSGFVQISVSDTGTGMPPEVLEHIFEPLFTTKANGGTGLGLAVTHQVVARHRGFIFAESAEGHGSTFHIFLPKATAPRPRLVVVERTPVAARRLLIVEDEEIIGDGLQGLLADEGFDAIVASSGAEALEAARMFEPELVLLDVGLPDLDGTEVARRIRECRPGTPIIFMTGHGDVHAEAALRKPFAIDELLDRIAQLERGS
jgi:CheY-like chemotaxis protein